MFTFCVGKPHDSRGQASRFAWASLTPTGWCGVNCYRRYVGAELAGAKMARLCFAGRRVMNIFLLRVGSFVCRTGINVLILCLLRVR